MKLLLLLPLSLLHGILASQTLTQQTLSVGSHLGEGRLVFTVGQIAGGSRFQDDLIYTEGFHQPTRLITSSNTVQVGLPVIAYPNPFSDEFYLRTPDQYEWVAELFDISGKRVKKLGPVKSNTAIQTRDWPSTALFIRVVRLRDGQSQTLKLKHID